MAKWAAFPRPGEYQFDAASVTKHWARLHAGDAEPCPQDRAVLEAWALFHSGEFQRLRKRAWRREATASPSPTNRRPSMPFTLRRRKRTSWTC